ncbi:MAG TPA: DUF2059 domain-containing protein [Thermoanaerobaculia bacterium]|jgi:hypothetical protein|nr:DUF2059 domain-containing protein [Thermoanaerobaculia bacterium]
MRPRLARFALTLTAVCLAVVSSACKRGGAPAATDATPTAVASTTPNAAASAAAAAAAQELFKAMKLQTNLNETASAMIDSEIGRNPGLTPYREVMLSWLKKYMTWDAMLPELTKMYTEAFTEAELKQMAAFYSSPAGQKSLDKLPEMMQRTAMTGARLSQVHSDELRAAMTAKSEELKKEAAASAPPAPSGQGKGPAKARPQAAPKQPQPQPQP